MEPCVADRNQTSDGGVETSARAHRTLAVILGVSSAAGIVLNLLVIIISVRHRQLRQPLSYALVNLAVCDLGCALFGGLPTTISGTLGHFHLGRVGCILEGFTVAFFGEWQHLCYSVVVKTSSRLAGIQIKTRSRLESIRTKTGSGPETIRSNQD